MEEITLMLLSVFQTVEFYVIMVFIAASVVGLAAMPSHRGQARQQLVAGTLVFDGEKSEPSIAVRVNDDRSVTICRYGLENVHQSGAYSLAATIIGFDITIEERLVNGSEDTPCAVAARASITGLAPERYHILYRSETTGRNAAFSLNIKPGNTLTRLLT